MGGAIAEERNARGGVQRLGGPRGGHRVFTSGVDVTMIGLEVTHKALLFPDQVEKLRGTGPVGKLVAELYDFYHAHHVRMYGWEGALLSTTPLPLRT